MNHFSFSSNEEIEALTKHKPKKVSLSQEKTQVLFQWLSQSFDTLYKPKKRNISLFLKIFFWWFLTWSFFVFLWFQTKEIFFEKNTQPSLWINKNHNDWIYYEKSTFWASHSYELSWKIDSSFDKKNNFIYIISLFITLTIIWGGFLVYRKK